MNLDLGHLLGTAISFGLVLFIIYRRFRRNFGKQRLSPKKLKFRMGLLAVIGVVLLPAVRTFALLGVAMVIGLGTGIALGVWAAQHTRFEKHDDKLYFIPHTYAGMVVSALFLGRLIYSLVLHASLLSLFFMDGNGVSPGGFGGLSAISHNPVTRCIFFILIGYYVYYYWYILKESEHLKPEDMEDAAEVKKEKPFGGNT